MYFRVYWCGRSFRGRSFHVRKSPFRHYLNQNITRNSRPPLSSLPQGVGRVVKDLPETKRRAGSMKDRGSKKARTSLTMARGPYSPQACDNCRTKKSKCSGEKPTCNPCRSYGRNCTWSSPSVNKSNSRQHIESLNTRIQGLESEVARYRVEQSISSDDPMSSLNLHLGTSSIPSEHHLGAVALENENLTSIFRNALQTPVGMSRFSEVTAKTSLSYVLLGDSGVGGSRYNPDFDWSRDLPPEISLDRNEHDKLLDLFFKFLSPWCLQIIPQLFLRDMWRTLSVLPSQPPPKTVHYSSMLHNAIIAFGSAFSDNPRIRDFKSRQSFAQQAKGFIDKECQSPNIATVNALSILGSFHASQGDPSLGYMYFGISGRIIQALGISVDCSPWVKSDLMSHDDMVDRNWVHWTTFCNDVCWSLYVGREVCMPESCLKNVPDPFIDSDFDRSEWHHPPSKFPPLPSNSSKIFSAACKLFGIGRRIVEILKLWKVPDSHHELILNYIGDIDADLTAWKNDLLPEVELSSATRTTAPPHCLMLHLAYEHLFILLHRPCYRYPCKGDQQTEVDHATICNRAADNIMDLLGTWHSSYTLRYVPIILIQVAFSAGTIFLLSAIQATSGERLARTSLHHSLSQAELCIQYLNEVGQSYQGAKNVADALTNLLQNQLKPRLTMLSSPNEPPAPELNGSPRSQFSEVFYGSTSTSRDQAPAFNPQILTGPQTQRENVHHLRGSPLYSMMNLDTFGGSPGSPFINQGISFPSTPNQWMPLGFPEPICYDPTFVQHHLGLPQDDDPLPVAQVELTDEERAWLQKILK